VDARHAWEARVTAAVMASTDKKCYPYVLDCKTCFHKSKTKLLLFCEHTRFQSGETLHTRCRIILISFGQYNYIGKPIGV